VETGDEHDPAIDQAGRIIIAELQRMVVAVVRVPGAAGAPEDGIRRRIGGGSYFRRGELGSLSTKIC
jgi:hypothetical protein